jgi:carotenoid 1,2-hydratase
LTLSIESGIERDHFRRPRGAGAYEWWYFDGYDPKARRGFVAIFFLGIPFSGVRQASATPEPEDFPAVAFSLYGPRGTEAYGVSLYPRSEVELQPMSLRIGLNEAQFDGQSYRIAFNADLLDKRRVFGTIVFAPQIRLHRRVDDGPHLWIVSAPRCSFQASLKIAGVPLELRGTGYHDHNAGTSSLQSRFERWEWGRAHFENETLIYYRVQPGGNHLIRIGRDGTMRIEDANLRETTHRRNLYGLRYPDLFAVSDMEVEQKRIVDNGPFYARFLSTFRRGAESVTGFSEVLRPRALAWRWFWPLLNTRVRPHGSGDVLGRRITQWLIEKGL